MAELVLHIGDMKTGTTSIQSALLKQNWQGTDRKVCYPVPPGQPYHHDLVELIRLGETERVNGWFEFLRRTVGESDAEVAVISSELLEEFPPEQVLEIFSHQMPEHAPTMRVIAYARPHAERVMSSWTQQVKLGFFSEGVEEFLPGFLARRKLAYYERFGAWRDAVGGRFTLRPMIRKALLNGDVVEDFMEQILPGARLTFPAGTEINETLGIADLAMLRMIHQHPRRHPDDRTHDVRMRMGEYLAYILSALRRPESPRPTMSRAAYDQVFEACEEDARMLDRSFFNRTAMSDALKTAGLRVTEEPQSLEAADYLTAEELRLAEAFALLLHDLMKGAPNRLNEVLMERITGVMHGPLLDG